MSSIQNISLLLVITTQAGENAKPGATSRPSSDSSYYFQYYQVGNGIDNGTISPVTKPISDGATTSSITISVINGTQLTPSTPNMTQPGFTPGKISRKSGSDFLKLDNLTQYGNSTTFIDQANSDVSAKNTQIEDFSVEVNYWINDTKFSFSCDPQIKDT